MDDTTGGNFKTIAFRSERPSTDWQKQSSSSHHGQRFLADQAKLIVSCYRRDEAHNPETFATALALILSDYPLEVINYATDPRTGVVAEFPMGLPNVGQIKEFLDDVKVRQTKAQHYAATPYRKREPSKPISPPPRKPEHKTYAEFLLMVERGEAKPRPIGFFESR